MILTFCGEVFEWRGPAPFFFVGVTPDVSEAIYEVAHLVTYGWGVIPVNVRIGSTNFTTSLFPKNGSYLVPIKAAVRRAIGIESGDNLEVTWTIELSRTW